jgi:hypothetical protein
LSKRRAEMLKRSPLVEFVGGPVCGKKQRVPKRRLAEYLLLCLGERKYLYAFAVRVNSKPASASNRYLFMGHKATLPEGVEEMD